MREGAIRRANGEMILIAQKREREKFQLKLRKVLWERLVMQSLLHKAQCEKPVARPRGSHSCSEINWKRMKFEIKEPQKRKHQTILHE